MTYFYILKNIEKLTGKGHDESGSYKLKRVKMLCTCKFETINFLALLG